MKKVATNRKGRGEKSSSLAASAKMTKLNWEREQEDNMKKWGDKNKAPNQGIVSTDRSIKGLLYWIQHPDQLSSRIQVILRPDIEPE